MKSNVFKEVADSLGYDEKIVKDVFDLTWDFIKEKIVALPLKDTDYTQEEFDKLKTSFKLPGLGKFGCSYESYLKKKKQFKRKRDDKDDKC